MKDAYAIKAEVGVDDTGAMLFIKYLCPHCDEVVSKSYFFSNADDVVDGFEVVSECPICGKKTAVYNSRPTKLY